VRSVQFTENDKATMPTPNRTAKRLEVAIFLFLLVPSLALSLFVTPEGSGGFRLTAVMVILRDLALVSLVLYFIWRNGEGLAQIGWCTDNIAREALLGVLLFIPMTYGVNVLEQFFTGLGLSTAPASSSGLLHPTSGSGLALAVVLVAVVALAEETIFRGYLLLRFIGLGMGRTAAVLLSSVTFAMGHGYEGWSGIATVAVMGILFAAVYLWRRSLVAPIVMHFLQDFLAIIVLPLLAGH
jgi:uncharacterized protein